MKITLESTTKVVMLEGEGGIMPARIWEGTTESGIKVHAFITRIATPQDADPAQFKAELQEQRPPSADVAAYPLRLVL